jgi:nucleotide-binding universal stress UspA family protein
MRALLAFDGSAGAEVAIALVAATHWPQGSSVRVVSVLEPSLGPVFGPPTFTYTWFAEAEAQARKELESEVAKVVGRLKDAGIDADGVVVPGRAATVLLEESAKYEADVVVAGSRGRGRIASLILGSVSAELVDHSPCPVLVARQPSAQRVLLATDGSAHANRAEQLIAEWPTFGEAQIRVLSVAEVVPPWHTGLAPTMYAAALEAYSKDLADARAAHTALASDAASRLEAAGRSVESKMREGDAAMEIIEEAATWPADLIVIGSRGRTGISRLVLGSVARNVLQGSQCSVLIVHAPAEAPDAAAEAAAEAARPSA